MHKHHERHHRATGGENEAEMDLKEKPEARTDAKNIDKEAEERKRGGLVKHKRHERKHGGHVHHEGHGPEHQPTHHRRKRRAGGGVESKEYDSKVVGKKKQDGEGFGLQNERTKRKHGGTAKHHEAHHVGHVHGEHAKHHAGRKARATGGQAASERNPFTTAAKGHAPKGRKLDMEMDGDMKSGV